MVFEISEEEREIIRRTINKTELIDVEILEVLGLYIWLRKGVRVKINRPNDPIRLQLMDQAYTSATNWLFENKYNE